MELFNVDKIAERTVDGFNKTFVEPPKEWALTQWERFKVWMDNAQENWFDFVGWLYTETTQLFFHTPIELIANPKVEALTNMFLELAVWGVGIMFAFEGIRIIFRGKARNFGEIITKTILGTVGAIVAPSVMLWAVWMVNKVSAAILAKSQGLTEGLDFATMFSTFGDGTLEFIGSVLFVIVYLYCLVKLLFLVAKRFFDLVVATSISPLALCGYIFETTEQFFKMWLGHVTGLYLFQLVYTVYFTIFSVFIIIPLPHEWDSVWIRLLLIVGGLWGISHPPQWIQNLGGGGRPFGVRDAYRKYRQFKRWKDPKPTNGGN